MELEASPCKLLLFGHQVLFSHHAAYTLWFLVRCITDQKAGPWQHIPFCPVGNNVRKKYICSLSSFDLLQVCFRKGIFTSSALLGLLQSTSFYNPPYFLTYAALSLVYCTKGIDICVWACILPLLSHSHNPLFKLLCSELMLVLHCLGYSLSLQEETSKDTSIARSTNQKSIAILITLPRKMHEPSDAFDFLGVFLGIKG